MKMRQRKHRTRTSCAGTFDVRVCGECYFINLSWRRRCHYCGGARWGR